jgi:hypothetical protein
MDQFYTRDEVASRLYNTFCEKVDVSNFDIILEPSAGKGAFYKLLPEDERVGLDLEPKYEGIQQLNFFDYVPLPLKIYAVIGNPPFGRVCSTAVDFFNKAAEFSKVIAFIIPRTFNRISIQNRLNLNFSLIYTEDLPLNPCCFEPKMSAKCCFQIWTRNTTPRKVTNLPSSHRDFSFVKYGPLDDLGIPTLPDKSSFDLVIKAYGANCGKIIPYSDALRAKSYHFIKSHIPLNLLTENISSLNFDVSLDTCRQSSLGRKDFVYIYTQA